jgi:hypothetical protein
LEVEAVLEADSVVVTNPRQENVKNESGNGIGRETANVNENAKTNGNAKTKTRQFVSYPQYSSAGVARSR